MNEFHSSHLCVFLIEQIDRIGERTNAQHGGCECWNQPFYYNESCWPMHCRCVVVQLDHSRYGECVYEIIGERANDSFCLETNYPRWWLWLCCYSLNAYHDVVYFHHIYSNEFMTIAAASEYGRPSILTCNRNPLDQSSSIAVVEYSQKCNTGTWSENHNRLCCDLSQACQPPCKQQTVPSSTEVARTVLRSIEQVSWRYFIADEIHAMT